MGSSARSESQLAGEAPFKLMGGSYTMMVLRIEDPNDHTFFPLLLDKIAQAPNFFRHAPVVLDVQAIAESGRPFNFAEFGRRLRQHLLIPVGVQNGNDALNQAAISAGMSVLPPGRPAQMADRAREMASAEGTAAREPQAAATEPGSGSLLVTDPVRSGRQLYAHRGDLVIMAPVSHGAELLADGHIHVYGPLRGRALAGVTGDVNARIFCQSLDAELISVAGYWRVREDIDESLIGKPVQIRLEGERLLIERLAP
jgi:septum site-determining protein MinC